MNIIYLAQFVSRKDLNNPKSSRLFILDQEPEVFYKVGYTSRCDVLMRFAGDNSPLRFYILDLIDTIEYAGHRFHAIEFEQKILKRLNNAYLGYTPRRSFSGRTECFKCQSEVEKIFSEEKKKYAYSVCEFAKQ